MHTNRTLPRTLAIGTLAFAALIGLSSPSDAGFRGGGFHGGGFHGGSFQGSPGSRGSMMGQRGFDRGKVASKDSSKDTSKNTSKNSSKTGSRTDSHDRPHHRRPHDKRPPVLVGPVVGSGVAASAAGPAAAGPSGGSGGSGNAGAPPAGDPAFVPNEVVLEFADGLPQQSVTQLLARQGLTELEAYRFTLTGSIFVRARITDGRPVPTALARLGSETILRTRQPNFYFTLAQSGARTGDPAQYALAKLHLREAHGLATGDRVVVAVIDSGVDLGHPELRGAIAGSYDALGSREPPHQHGTGIAGTIAANARLLGAAPAARILAIRAFGANGGDARATSFAILKAVEYAATHEARVINMSFNGPFDPAQARQLEAARARGIVLVAASGNLGPKAAPQYPAADPNVIAVGATDANDRLFKAAGTGPHIALTAPGVDILVPAPSANYQVTSGTSFAAAYVSGVAALLLQRSPGLTPEQVRRILESTAKDLGPRGRDTEFGAGLVDAYAAIVAARPSAAVEAPPKVVRR